MRSALPSAVSCEGKQGNPSLSPAYFRTACRFPQKSAKTVHKRRFAFAGLVFTRCGAFSLPHGATQGLTRRSHLHRRSLGFVIGFRQIHFLSGEAAVENLTAAFLAAVIGAERFVGRNGKIMQRVGLPLVIRAVANTDPPFVQIKFEQRSDSVVCMDICTDLAKVFKADRIRFNKSGGEGFGGWRTAHHGHTDGIGMPPASGRGSSRL